MFGVIFVSFAIALLFASAPKRMSPCWRKHENKELGNGYSVHKKLRLSSDMLEERSECNTSQSVTFVYNFLLFKFYTPNFFVQFSAFKNSALLSEALLFSVYMNS